MASPIIGHSIRSENTALIDFPPFLFPELKPPPQEGLSLRFASLMDVILPDYSKKEGCGKKVRFAGHSTNLEAPVLQSEPESKHKRGADSGYEPDSDDDDTSSLKESNPDLDNTTENALSKSVTLLEDQCPDMRESPFPLLYSTKAALPSKANMPRRAVRKIGLRMKPLLRKILRLHTV